MACQNVSRASSAHRRGGPRHSHPERDQRHRRSVSPCASEDSLASANQSSDPEYGFIPDRYTFHNNSEIWKREDYYCHYSAAHEMAPERSPGDGTHPAVRELELRNLDPVNNLSDIVHLLMSDMRVDGLPLIRLKFLKKTHSRYPMTIARVQFKSVHDVFVALGRYHKVDAYRDFAACHGLLRGRPVPGSIKYPGAWVFRDAGEVIACR